MKAINEISKSGEVWCEGARLCMTKNKSNSFYSLKNALQYLKFADLASLANKQQMLRRSFELHWQKHLLQVLVSSYCR